MKPSFISDFSPEKITQSTDKEESAFRADHEAERRTLENTSFKQDIAERKTFASKAFCISYAWIGFLITLTVGQFFLKKWGFGLSGIEFNIVFSTTTGSVLVFWYLVGKYLFNSQKTL
jgi:hypothetical protein